MTGDGEKGPKGLCTVYELLSSTQLLVAVNRWQVALLVLLLSSNGSQEASGKGKGVHFVSATTATTQLKLAKLLCGDEPSMPCATWNVLFQSLEANENLPIGTSGNLQKSFLFKKMKNQSWKGPSSNTHLKHLSAQRGNEEWYSPNASTFYQSHFDIPVYPNGFCRCFIIDENVSWRLLSFALKIVVLRRLPALQWTYITYLDHLGSFLPGTPATLDLWKIISFNSAAVISGNMQILDVRMNVDHPRNLITSWLKAG